ncbi:DUF3416 domain-containing protein [Sphingobacteriales bacterium UPWRP_1]|nr:alpha-1,4-glucan--maltose-1-phosphate maltosyltransferase [Sphingobacteriales bacterium TSM_CSM]PSJ78556.1 DUF3416 domain-containing protein [Sphingobacteriales bacterium UPWRP_1]
MMQHGQSRAVIENVYPELNGGKHSIKRVVGQSVTVEADIIADGHDVVAAMLKYRSKTAKKWQHEPMKPANNGKWQATFVVQQQGFYEYTIEAWIDHALTWQHGTVRKIDDGQKVTSELLEGVLYLDKIVPFCTEEEEGYANYVKQLFTDETRYHEAILHVKSENLHNLFLKYPTKDFATTYPPLHVYVDRLKALYSTWYEFFPRSAAQEPGKHGTFEDCIKLLPRVAEMGFDVLYFPPIHPIGEVNRKGKNNATTAQPDDVGSPWGIGSALGGHKSIHPQLGTLEDFLKLVEAAKQQGIEIAMDLALQCAPDHPYVKEHPQWFKWRPDGTVQYAENPPKKYQDILPIFFETPDWQNLWNELLSIVLYWAEKGIAIFRVDNPHTKPFRFWEWLIAEVKKQYPDVLFLAEAFTGPAIMNQLGKLGFTQSYTYYTWRIHKHEIMEYMNELSQTVSREYFRPNFWPNTPDINPYMMQTGNEAVFFIRLFMAATLSSSYGLYGPVFEFIDYEAVPGKEEYHDSEKYELKHWDWNRKTRLTYLITILNKIRRHNPALQDFTNIQFCPVENNHLLAYYKTTPDKQNQLLMVVNLDPFHRQWGMVRLPFEAMGAHPGEKITMSDLISGNSYVWSSEYNYVELSPELPFHLFRIQRNLW